MICATPRQKSSALHNSAFIPKCRMTKVHKLRLLCIKTRFPLSVNNAKTSSSSRYCYENLDQYTWQLQTAELPRYTEKGERGGSNFALTDAFHKAFTTSYYLLRSPATPRKSDNTDYRVFGDKKMQHVFATRAWGVNRQVLVAVPVKSGFKWG